MVCLNRLKQHLAQLMLKSALFLMKYHPILVWKLSKKPQLFIVNTNVMRFLQWVVAR